MRDRIWNDLRNSIFYIEYLSLLIKKEKSKNKLIEFILLTTSIFGIAGWHKWVEHSIIWTILLSLVITVRILKPKITTSAENIASYQALKTFYLDHYRDLENLWYKFENEKISERQAEKVFDKLNEAERIIIKIEKHDKLFGKEPFHSKAEDFAAEKLKKYC
ncbi:MAG: hypothetical protein ACI9XO_004880 [Paraglaciecola sp.]|jgi:hypothetical protein